MCKRCYQVLPVPRTLSQPTWESSLLREPGLVFLVHPGTGCAGLRCLQNPAKAVTLLAEGLGECPWFLHPHPFMGGQRRHHLRGLRLER